MKTKESAAILTVESLTVQFEQYNTIRNLIDGISFSLLKGESLGIVGESGSGKSLTALSLMGLLPTSNTLKKRGTIIFSPPGENPINISGLPENEMRWLRGSRIAMIFQEPMTSLNPTMKCGRQVMENLLLHKSLSPQEAKSKTLALFEEVQLPRPESIFYTYPHQLSGGQKQRVMIAMALACNPEILIADEPTTALDVTVQKTILHLLKSLQEKHGLSLIFISHDLAVVGEIADRVLVMYNGRVVEEGSREQIFQHPGHPYTKGLLACRPAIGSRPVRLNVISDFMKDQEVTSLKEDTIHETSREFRHKDIYSRPPLLQAENLSKRYILSRSLTGKPVETVNAVQKVTLEVYRGETLGLVGESGSGKSTLGRMLIKLVESDSGNIIYDQDILDKLSPKALRLLRKRVQIIFQDPYSSLNPMFTVGETLMEPMLVHNLCRTKGDRKRRAMELLEKTGLEAEHFYRFPHELSGGQRQRLSIARALSVEPEFIICDESVSALDVSVQAQVLNLLNDLKNDFGLTYIFISHDLAVVHYMSDRVVVMQNGQILEVGEADALFENPGSEHTRTLINAVPGFYSSGDQHGTRR